MKGKKRRKNSNRSKKEAPVRQPRRKDGLRTALLLLLSAVFLLFWCLLIGTRTFAVWKLGAYFSEPIILFLNLLPIALLMAVCYALSNRAWVSFLITSVLCLLMAYVNYFKVSLRGEPFVIDDLGFVGEGTGIMGEYTFHIPISLFVSIAVVVGITLLLKRYAKSGIDKPFRWIRAAIVLLCIGLGAFSWKQWYTDEILYHNTLVGVQHTFSFWRDEERSAGGGLFWSFLRSVDEAYPPAPEGYSEEAVEETLAQYPDAAIPEDKKVNLIVTMLESFSDLSVFPDVEFYEDPYAEFHALQSESYHGTLVDDSIGGGTINAERAFLTGFAYRQPGYNGNTASFVRYLNQNGYHTEGAHPGYSWFYSRDSINRRLGFAEYVFRDGHFDELVSGDDSYQGYATDAQLFADRRRAYEQRDPSVPYFSFSVSYQGHSPYDAEGMEGTEYIGGISQEGYNVVNNYLNSVADTGKQMAAFADTFRNDPEPVVLVFFGDHKPTLGDGNVFYKELGITSAPSTSYDRYSLYSTPYLIWANDAAKELLGRDFTGEGRTISPCYLMSEVFDCCGWTGPSWLQFQRTVRDTLPVLHFRDYVFRGNSLTLTKNYDEQKAFAEFEKVEYYVRQKKPVMQASDEG